MVTAAIRRGVLVRKPCDVCGKKRGVVAHHEDYDYPMQVRWLCREHHMRELWALWEYTGQRPVPKAKKAKVQAPLPPGVTGPHRRRYGATLRDAEGKLLHLGFFRTVEEAEQAIASYQPSRPFHS